VRVEEEFVFQSGGIVFYPSSSDGNADEQGVAVPPSFQSQNMNKPRILTASVAAFLVVPHLAFADERNWTGGAGTADWNDPLNWAAGVPTTDTNDNIYVRLPGTITAPAINAGVLRIAVGSPTVPTSGFTFGAGNFTFSEIQVADAHNGLNPTSNRYGRAFINAGTTITTGQFFVGEWDGGTGHVVQSGGDVIINTQFRVGHWPQQQQPGGGLTSTYTMNGGTITVNGDPANPYEENAGGEGNVFLGIDSTGVFTVNGGTFSAKGIAFDNRGASEGEDTLEINGGTVNIGANGLGSNENSGNTATYEIRLSGGALRATAPWASNLETTLVAGGTGITYDTNGNSITLSGVLKGTGGLNKSGAGSLILTGPNTYSGPTTINAGTVEVGNGGTSGSVGTGAVVINAGSTLAFKRTDTLLVEGQVSGTGTISVDLGTLRLANANGSVAATVTTGTTLGAAGTMGALAVNSGGTLEAGVSGSGTLTASSVNLSGSTLKLTVGASSTKLVVTAANGLQATGTNTIQVNAINLTPGTYQLIDYNGTIGGAGFPSFVLTGLPSRAIGGMVHNTAGTSIDLNVTAIDFPKWTGALSGVWDGVTQNWQLVGGGTATNFQNFDAVLFDDSATGLTSIDVGSAFTPSSVIFNNTAKTYTLTGAGGIGGDTGITKQGTGRVILATTNTYTGPTNVQAGILQFGDGVVGSLGTTPINIAAGATVELNIVSNFNSLTSVNGTLRTIGSGTFEIGGALLSGAGALNVAGTETHVVSIGNQGAFDGPITITGGTLRATGIQALGSTTGTTTITDGGTLDVNGLDLGAENILVSGAGAGGNGAIVNNGGGTILNLHRVTLTGPTSFGGGARWDIRQTNVGTELLDLAGFKLTKVGGNQVSVVNIDITPGDIDINGGTFSIEDVATVPGPGTITINPNGALGLWVNKPGEVTRNIVAAGGAITELGSNGATMVNSAISLQANLDVNVINGNTVLTLAGNLTESGGARTLNVNPGGQAGRLVLTGTNTWTGGTNINAGSLQIGAIGGTTGNIGTGPLTLNGTLVTARSDGFTFTEDINTAGPAGGLTLAGDGTVNLAAGVDIQINELQFGINNFNDTLGGTLNIANGNSLVVQNAVIVGNSGGGGAPSVGIINQTGGSFTVNAQNTDGRNFVIGHWPQGQGTYNQSGGTLDSPNISMAISWDGSGTYNLSGGTASVYGLRFGHNGAQSGVFNLTGGTLNLGPEGIWEQNAGLPNDINLGGGTITASVSTNIFLPSELTGTNGNVNFNTNGNTLAVSGPMSGPGGFTKSGAGVLELTNANTYTGSTTVNAGTLRVNNSFGSATGSGNVTIAAGARLEGTGTIGEGFGAVAASISGKIAPGNGPGPGTLTMNLGTGALNLVGAVTGPGTGALEFELGPTSDLIVLTTGGLTIGTGVLELDDFLFTLLGGFAQGDYVLIDGNSPINGTLGPNVSGLISPNFFATLQFANGTNDLILHVVPEPGSASVMIAGIGMLLGLRRHRRSA
jgi:fibronectin-binding autotransporter adhesin